MMKCGKDGACRQAHSLWPRNHVMKELEEISLIRGSDGVRMDLAKAAMQGILANTRFDFTELPSALADYSFKIADAMIERSKES